jgi:hypothetical protein
LRLLLAQLCTDPQTQLSSVQYPPLNCEYAVVRKFPVAASGYPLPFSLSSRHASLVQCFREPTSDGSSSSDDEQREPHVERRAEPINTATASTGRTQARTQPASTADTLRSIVRGDRSVRAHHSQLCASHTTQLFRSWVVPWCPCGVHDPRCESRGEYSTCEVPPATVQAAPLTHSHTWQAPAALVDAHYWERLSGGQLTALGHLTPEVRIVGFVCGSRLTPVGRGMPPHHTPPYIHHQR